MTRTRGDSMLDRSMPTLLAAFACRRSSSAPAAPRPRSRRSPSSFAVAAGGTLRHQHARHRRHRRADGRPAHHRSRTGPGGGGVTGDGRPSRTRRPTGRRCSSPTTRPSSSIAAMTERILRSIRSPTSSRSRRCSRFRSCSRCRRASKRRPVPELVALAKKQVRAACPTRSQGVGTAGHLLGELFAKSQRRAAGACSLSRARRQGVIDLVAGRLDMMFIGVLPTKPHLESGKLRALAVTSKTRTAGGAGRADHRRSRATRTSTPISSGSASRRRPRPRRPIVASLHDRFTKALTSKALQQKLAEQGVDLGASTPDGFVARIKADTARFGPLIRESGATR